HDGTMIFSKGYGEAVLKEQTPITPQTIFYAGSISKQFTAAAIALLSTRGDIELDRPVRDYIPEMQENTEYPPITVRQLVHHTIVLIDLYALLRLYDVQLNDGVTGEELLKIITSQSHLNFEPGSDYMYSNSGYTLLAELVKRVSGQTLREYTIEHIFEPLGMNNTHFHDDHTHGIDNQALSYWGNNQDFRLGYISSFEGAGPGGLYTTIGVMLKWNQQLSRNRLPDAEEFNELMRRRGVLNNGDTLSYAFALKIDKYKGQKSVGHGGSFMGFKADYLRLPEHGYGAALLCNLGSIDPGELNRELADVILKAPIEKWLTRYAGTYYSKALDLEYTISVKDANLYLDDRERSPEGKLRYTGDHTFSTGSWDIEFTATGQDKVAGFKLSSGRAQNIYFEKK